jgi:predicted secreted protein
VKFKGSDFRVRIKLDNTWDFIPGERSTSAKVNNEQVDTTDKDGVPWRGLSACGIRSGEITVSGIVRDDSTKRIFNSLMSSVMTGTLVELKIPTEPYEMMQGLFLVTSLERTGEYNGAEVYSASFASGNANDGLMKIGTAAWRIATWNTTAGSSDADQFQLPLLASGSYDFIVDWGDGNQDAITVWNQTETLHTYAVAGEYEIQIIGRCHGIRFNNGGDRNKLIVIRSWGASFRVSDEGIPLVGAGVFYGCQFLNVLATDNLVTTNISDMLAFFKGCSSLDNVPSILTWDLSLVPDIASMFFGCANFNQDITALNVSKMENLSFVFSSAEIFNQPVGAWDVSSCIYFNGTFQNAYAFNQPLNAWNIADGSGGMSLMFRYAIAFNQPLDTWDVSKVPNMNNMFDNAWSFKQNLGAWDVRSLTTATNFLRGADINAPDSATSRANYDALLVGWTGWSAGAPGAKGLALQSGVQFHGGNSKYTAASDAAAARAWLVATKGWTITDGGAF